MEKEQGMLLEWRKTDGKNEGLELQTGNREIERGQRQTIMKQEVVPLKDRSGRGKY